MEKQPLVAKEVVALCLGAWNRIISYFVIYFLNMKKVALRRKVCGNCATCDGRLISQSVRRLLSKAAISPRLLKDTAKLGGNFQLHRGNLCGVSVGVFTAWLVFSYRTPHLYFANCLSHDLYVAEA